MKVEKIKKLIKEKFGTMSKFAILAGIDRMELQKDFNTRTMDADTVTTYLHKIDVTELQALDGEISPEKLERLREALNDVGGVLAFVEANPKFSIHSVYQVLNGRRKRMTPLVKSLFEHFLI